MSMLAERRRKTKWVINPTKKPLWTIDSGGIKLVKELMEKMGWSPGKGLGSKEQGMQEPLKVSYKNDTKGMGFKGNDEDWIEHQDGFNSLLSELSSQCPTAKPTDAERNEIKSLEEKSRQSRARVHYQKFTRGKDMSKYSENDLACILGTNKLKKETKSPKVEEKIVVKDGFETSFGVTTINSGSIEDYFKNKFSSNKQKIYNADENRNFQDGDNSILGDMNGYESGVNGKKRKHEAVNDEENDDLQNFNQVDDLTVPVSKEKKKRKKEKVKDISKVSCGSDTKENNDDTVIGGNEFELKKSVEDDCDFNNGMNQVLSNHQNCTVEVQGSEELQMEQTKEGNLKINKKKKKSKEKNVQEEMEISKIDKKKKSKRREKELEECPVDATKDVKPFECESNLNENEKTLNIVQNGDCIEEENIAIEPLKKKKKGKKREKELEECSPAVCVDATKKVELFESESKESGKTLDLTKNGDSIEGENNAIEPLKKKKKSKKREKELGECPPAECVGTTKDVQFFEGKTNFNETEKTLDSSLAQNDDCIEEENNAIGSKKKKKKSKKREKELEECPPTECVDSTKDAESLECESNFNKNGQTLDLNLAQNGDCIEENNAIEPLKKKKKKKSKDVEPQTNENLLVLNNNNEIIESEPVLVKKKKHKKLEPTNCEITESLNTDTVSIKKEKKLKVNEEKNENLEKSDPSETVEECTIKKKKSKKRHKEIREPENELGENINEETHSEANAEKPESNESGDNSTRISESSKLSEKDKTKSELKADSNKFNSNEGVIIHSHKLELFKKKNLKILPNSQNYTNSRVLKLVCGAEFEKFKGSNLTDLIGYGNKKGTKDSAGTNPTTVLS